MRYVVLFLMVLSISMLRVVAVKADDMSCLAEAVYFEARSEPFIAQLAVANVVLERVYSERYPDNVCDVVHQAKKWKGKTHKKQVPVFLLVRR